VWNAVTVGILATAAVVLPFNLDWLEFGLVSVGLVIVSIVVSVVVARRMAAPAKIAGGDRSRGVVRLRFRNADYARAVATQLNS
jgi:hypothetical protein